MVILHCSKFSYLSQPRYIVYFEVVSPGYGRPIRQTNIFILWFLLSIYLLFFLA